MEPNAGDFAITPNLALLSYRRSYEEAIFRRPAGVLVERLLPEPA